MFSTLMAIAALVGAAATHEEQNPVYRELLETGVAASGQSRRLPPPTLADGLAADAQIKAIEELGGDQYPFAKLARKSVVAPQIIRVPEVEDRDAETPLRTVDVWFIAHVDLEVLDDEAFLGKLLAVSDDGRSVELTPQQLEARGISAASVDPEHEGFDHIQYTLLDKVHLRLTGRSFWSRTDDSIVAAVIVDPRFRDDAEFPNQWRLVEAADAAPTPYEGLGFYAKITRLREPAGALLVEFHLVFAEPVAWFRGTNQLGAKLPAVMQNQVREARRHMMQAARTGD